MKKVIILVTIMLAFFTTGCNSPKNQEKNDAQKAKAVEQQTEEATIERDDPKKTAAPAPLSRTMKARFKEVVPNTDGAIYVFVDESGKEWKLWEIKETEGMDFARSVAPNRIYSRFESQWFEVTWGKRRKAFNQGGGEQEKRAVSAVLSVKEIGQEEGTAPAIRFKELQEAVFFGTEPFWTVKFRNDHMYYTGGPGEPEKKYNYLKEPGENTPVRAISDNEVQVNVWPASNKTGQHRWHIKISKKPCSDGMSEKTYPYSIEIRREDAEEHDEGGIGKGCGRVVNKTVTIGEIQESKKVEDYAVSKCMYKPKDEFNIGFDHLFQFSGHFTINPMSDQLNFHVDKDQRPKINVKIEGFTRPLITSFYFPNEQEVQEALGNEKMKQIREGKKVEATISFKNYHIAGKLDGYGGAYAEFVSLK